MKVTKEKPKIIAELTIEEAEELKEALGPTCKCYELFEQLRKYI